MSRTKQKSRIPLALERVELTSVDWDALDRRPDREVFQTRGWLQFLASTQRAEPVVAELRSAGETVGYFTGALVRRLGARMLGSPFPGWTTSVMGFNIDRGVDRRAALDALAPFAFRELGCLHVEIKDRRLAADDLKAAGYAVSGFQSFEIDLARDEDDLFAAMSSACRRAIRKSAREGVSLEEASDEGFADDYYSQLVDVFAKQNLVPPYGADRVRELIRRVHPSGNLLLLRARAPDGRCIATGIFPGMNGTAWFWGGASWRSDQILRPNEAIFWYAMRYWRNRGVRTLDTGGGGDYKRKYGVVETCVPMGRRARVRALLPIRDAAAKLYARAAFGGRA